MNSRGSQLATPKSLQRFRRAICRIECRESTALHRRAGGRRLERVLGNCVAPDARATTGIFREAQKKKGGTIWVSPYERPRRRTALRIRRVLVLVGLDLRNAAGLQQRAAANSGDRRAKSLRGAPRGFRILPYCTRHQTSVDVTLYALCLAVAPHCTGTDDDCTEQQQWR